MANYFCLLCLELGSHVNLLASNIPSILVAFIATMIVRLDGTRIVRVVHRRLGGRRARAKDRLVALQNGRCLRESRASLRTREWGPLVLAVPIAVVGWVWGASFFAVALVVFTWLWRR